MVTENAFEFSVTGVLCMLIGEVRYLGVSCTKNH